MRNFIIWGLFITTITSCSSLQYRETDVELKKRFLQNETNISIDYFEDKDSGYRIRSLKTEGQNNKTTLVFFHGSPSSISAWRGYLNDSLLQKKATMYAIDRPGYGYSNFGKAMTSIEKQAKIMSDLINAKKLQNVIVVGASYGGPLAARVAVINDKVKGVVMISPAIDPAQEKKIWQANFTQWWLTRWLVPTGYRVAGDEKTTHPAELKILEKDWGSLNIPIIHIHGDKDEIVPFGNINYTNKVFKNSKIVLIKNRGHEIAWKNPEIIMPLLFDLIENLSQD